MQNNTEIEISLIIDERPEHYAYCNNINEAIETLQHLKNQKEEKGNYFKLDEIRFEGVSGRSDLERFLKEPESYIFNSQKTGKPWSKEASQKIIRCRFCEHNKIGSGLRQCYGCKYNIKAEEVKEYEE